MPRDVANAWAKRAPLVDRLGAHMHVLGTRGVGIVVAGEAPAHLDHLALTGRVQPHDVGHAHGRRNDYLVNILLDHERLREGVNLLPRYSRLRL